MPNKKRLFLVDGMSNIFRSYYAIRGLSNSKGLPTNSTYGFTVTLRKLMKDHRPDYLGVVLDSKEMTFRQEQYADYKAHRPDMPEDLVAQLPYILRVCEALRVPVLRMPRYEADDIIGALAKQATEAGLQTVVVTNDKDLSQLVRDDEVLMLRMDKNGENLLNEDGVKAKYGVRPDQIVDWLGLMGDAVDGIPGAPGIGEKGAASLLAEFGTIDNALANWEQVKKKTYRESLRDHADQIRFSRELARIDLNVPVKLDLEALIVEEPDQKLAYELFNELEFAQLKQEFKGGAKPGEAAAVNKQEGAASYRRITKVEDLRRLVKTFYDREQFAFALSETESGKLGVAAFSTSSGSADYFDFENCDDPKEAVNLLKDAFGNGLIEKSTHDLKGATRLLEGLGVELENVTDDTMLQAYLLDSDRTKYELPQLASEYLDHSITTGEESTIAQYADATGRLADVLNARILEDKIQYDFQQEKLDFVYRKIEMPLIPLLYEMEEAGFRVSTGVLEKLSVEMEKELDKLSKKIYELAGREFNIGSPQQLGEIFEELNYQVSRRTATGKIATSRDVLDELAEKYELPRLIIDHRELAKLKGTYVDAFPQLINPADGRIRTTLNQTIAATGRLSSINPNLQNIPIRTEMGRRIRRAFIPADGHVLLSADYSQIELRLLAHVTKDEVMLETFRKGEDIHARTAAAVFKAKTAEEMKDARRKAKIVNFGIAYVIGPFGLAQRVGISRNEAKKVIDEYYQTYAGVKKYMDELPDRARENGCEVRSIFGRKRRVPDLEGKGSARARAEREAVNMPMQGCLPWGAKVLTSEGYRAIGRLYGEQRRDLKVWTGSGFASFEVLNRGRCELAELHLSNGHILKCDTRHEVLTITEEGYAWKHYSDLNTGDRICLSLAQEMEFGKLPTPEYVHTPVAFNGQPLVIEKLDERFFYWLGYYFGDGWIYHRPEDNRWYLSYSLGASKVEGRHGLLAKAEECRAYFGSLGLKTNLRWQSLQKAEIKVFSKGLINFLAEIGVNTRANAMTKRAPEFVFSSPLASRKAFLRGFLDADGYAGDNGATNPSMHLCQRDLLVDLWLLFRTVGVEGKLRGPYNYQKDFISYRLDLIGGQVGRSLGYSNCHFIHIPGMHAPAFLTAAFLAEVPSSRFGEGSHRVLYSRLKQGGAISVYTLAEMLRAADHQLSLPLYAWSSLRQKSELGITEETYTLAVDDPLHRFDSEGVISKNTASDIVKLAMLRVAESLRREKLEAKMILQVHDELVFEVPKKEVEKTSQVVKAAMENAAKIDAPLIVEIGVGENWVDAKP
jgi:DNA polymerase I